MAIKIPSKHIYDIEYNAIINNSIGYTTVEAKEPQIINDSTNVYNERITNASIGNTQKDQQNGKIYSTVGQNPRTSHAALAYVEVTPTYTTKTITIPKNIQNNRVVSILTGVDSNDSPNIKYSLSGTTKIGNATAQGAVWAQDIIEGIYQSRIENIQPTNLTIKDNISFVLPDTTKAIKASYTKTTTPIGGGTEIVSTATASVKLLDQSNVLSITASDNGDSFTLLNLKILSGLKIVTLSGLVNANSRTVNKPNPDWDSLYTTINGEYEEYIPSQIDISFYGDIIKLDLQDQTVTIGDSGTAYLSDGNELIQTTNNPTLDSQYQGLINKWENGKASAVISCPVVDFYDTDGNKVIDINTDDKMLFKIGDVVIPYTYTNQGDIPLAYNEDFTPKQFIVLGTEISTEQGVKQTLTLLEYVS